MTSVEFGIDEVVARGLCIGCGGCGQVGEPGKGKIRLPLSPLGTRVPDLGSMSQSQKDFANRVCPLSDQSMDEDTIAVERGLVGSLHDSRLGYFDSLHFGRVISETINTASSGGMLGAVLDHLIDTGVVDDAIQVGRDSNGDLRYGLRSLLDSVSVGSIYEPIGIEPGLLGELVVPGRKYALVGLPCTLRSISNLMHLQPNLRESLPILAGLVCGHLKSRFFGDALANELNLPESLRSELRYRIKAADGNPGNYFMGIPDATGLALQGKSMRASRFFAADWGLAMFQLDGCNFCDDIFAECADFVVGDAWLKEFSQEPQGTSVIVSRNPQITRAVIQLQREGKVWARTGSVAETASTQAGNIRYRRDGLALRLDDDASLGILSPKKRVFSTKKLKLIRQAIYRSRRNIAQKSNEGFLRINETYPYLEFKRDLAKITFRHSILVWLEASTVTKLKSLIFSLITTTRSKFRRRGRDE